MVPLRIEGLTKGIQVRSACIRVRLATLRVMRRVVSWEYIRSRIRFESFWRGDHIEGLGEAREELLPTLG
jgi:hypothetical protein